METSPKTLLRSDISKIENETEQSMCHLNALRLYLDHNICDINDMYVTYHT